MANKKSIIILNCETSDTTLAVFQKLRQVVIPHLLVFVFGGWLRSASLNKSTRALGQSRLRAELMEITLANNIKLPICTSSRT